MSDFASLDEVKTFLDLQADDNDAVLVNLIRQTTKIMQSVMGRNIFLQSSITEYHSGDGKSHDLILLEYPIVTVTSIHDDISRLFDSGTLLIEATDGVEGDYRILDKNNPQGENPGIVRMLDGGVWSKGDENIKVIYSAGYDTEDVPEDLVSAQVDFVAYMYNNRDRRTGIKAFRLGQFSITYDEINQRNYYRSIPDAVFDILMMYKNINIQSTENSTGI